MLVSLLIVFREAMEAGLIVGIVLAATQGVAGRGRWIAGGIAAGTAGASLVAAFAAALSDAFQGAGQEIFTAAILCFAVVMLSWHILWMSSHARSMAAEFRAVGQAVRLGQRSLAALGAVVAIAVMREGAEVVLFLYGIVAGSQTSALSLASGGVAGLALAAALSWLLYRGLVIIPVHRLFSVTNGLIALLAAGMAGQAAATLHGADLLPGWGEHLWDTSALLSDDSLVGRSLHALIGYSARPSGIQFAAWLATLLMLVVASRVIGRPRPRSLAAAMVLAALLAAGPSARADEVPTLVFHNHRFEPARIEVPAHVKFRLQVKNTDDTADEFESTSLNREKLVPPGQTITVFLGPLEPGEYEFFGDFHQDTAQGVLVAK
ncbi:MAG: FTR1 family protein [Rhodopila sp.]|nr:FTR1 family protein [Rhodopila sp.]